VIRAVLDTNAIVSGVLVAGGTSSRVLDAAQAGQFT
jgi:predicted nucleic acid-binding protein